VARTRCLRSIKSWLTLEGSQSGRRRRAVRSADSTLPHLWPTGSSWGLSPSIAARHFSSCPSDSPLRWTPCPPEYSKQRLQVRLGCIQLSLSCPFRRLHTFCLLRPARLLPPAFGYGAPHLSARGTLTLLNNALLSTHYRALKAAELAYGEATRPHVQATFLNEVLKVGSSIAQQSGDEGAIARWSQRSPRQN